MRTRAPSPARIVAAVVATVIVSAGCRIGQPSTQQARGETEALASPSSTLADSVDCDSLVDAAPAEAGDALEDEGYSVSWRSVQTASDGTAVADVEASIPPGRIVDIIIEGNQAVVFVADSEDPAAASPDPPTC